ncbi:MAG: phosphate acyltransferase PlsX [Clostridia bacterium]|nr:phosphate acyltransferase PlsX [Clostridia bacterium]
MKIVIDAFGGDNSPVEIVKGAITSVNLIKDISIILTGDKDKVQAILDEYGYKGDRIEIVHAPDVITNNESPTSAIRTKKESSLVVGFNTLKNTEDAIGFISAGSTGAVLAGGTFIVGRMENVLRPALAPMLPNIVGGRTMLIDCGANVDCKPEYLKQFAIMGSVYIKSMLGIENPRVGLLNIGVEDKKGNALTHEAFPLLKECKEINFIGNVEARDILSGEVDVLVSDGFAGNVALKSTEGAVMNLLKLIKSSIKEAGLGAKIGATLMKKVFKSIKSRMDYNTQGGSPFVGINKIVVKSHGTSTAETILSCVKQVKEIHESGFIESLKTGINLTEN